MAIVVGDILRISAVVSYQAQEFVNVHHFKTIANATADDTAFMVALQAVLAPTYALAQNWQSDELRYERLEGQNVSQSILLPTVNWVGNPNGDQISDPLPAQVTANVYWPTLRPRTRCTVYLPGFTTFTLDSLGKWDAPMITDLQSFGTAFLSDATLGGMTVRKGAYNLEFDRFTELNAAVVPADSRTQRRRRLGVGI